jgi:hypothetical protein
MAPTRLGTQDCRFTVGGKPTFLLGISYYGALAAPGAFIEPDLEDMQRYGFNWLRVWVRWKGTSAVDADGEAIEPYMSRLVRLVDLCEQRSMVVDVTFVRSNGQEPLQAIAQALKPYRNVYIDLCNEHDIQFVSFKEMKKRLDWVKEVDSERLVAASYWLYDTSRAALREYYVQVRPDILAPHLPRYQEAPQRTEEKTLDLLRMMPRLGETIPVHYQEPFRRGFRPDEWEPQVEDFLADLKGAIAGGAAGWCFHNGDQRDRPENRPYRSFGMREQRLFDQFDEEDRRILEGIRSIAEKIA